MFFEIKEIFHNTWLSEKKLENEGREDVITFVWREVSVTMSVQLNEGYHSYSGIFMDIKR